MYTISGGGSFTRTNIDQINSNFAEVAGSGADGVSVDVYINPAYGNNANNGLSAGAPKATLAGCARLIEPGIRIGLLGVLFEEYTGPIVNDVTLIGLGNQPRQATTSGAPNGGGATWLSPSGGTGTLLKITGQAWKIQNIFFNNSATGATTSCVHIDCVGDPPAEADASHTQIVGCVLQGSNFGVYAPLGPNFVTIAGCTFSNFAGSGDTAIKAAQSVRTLLGWKVLNNYFYNNVHNIVATLSRGTLTGNSVVVHGNSVTSTTGIALSGGAGNVVMANTFEDNLTGAVAAWSGGTNDAWCNMYADDGFASGVPS